MKEDALIEDTSLDRRTRLARHWEGKHTKSCYRYLPNLFMAKCMIAGQEIHDRWVASE